ncbi:DNA-binding LacI/PurR family transcriptional regulator [Microbacterium sp. AK031]|nr:DNA-binding LacI/PurR family transcriptional regulator [Microbacterium sp. AK031]
MPIARSGALAVDVLLQAIVGTVVDDITLGSQLIVRASTAVAAA